MTFYDGLLFFSLFTAIFPLVWLFVLPFKERHEYFIWRRSAKIALFCIAVVAIGFVVNSQFHFERNANTALFAAIPIAFLYYRKTIAAERQKWLFVFCLALHTSAALTAVRVPVNLLADALASDRAQADLLIEVFMITARIIYYPLIIWLIQRYITPCLKRIEPKNMKRLWIVPATFIIIAILSYTYYAPQNSVMQLFAIYIPLNILAFIVYTIILNMLDNVTKNARLEAEGLVLERTNHIKSELMSTISHEARTPLAVLSSYASLVSMELKAKGVEEQTAADLDRVVFEAQRVAELIDSMSNAQFIMHNAQFGGKAAERVSLDIGETIRQTAGLFRHLLERNGTELEVRIGKDLPMICANPEELTQVLFNLLQNARSACADGGNNSQFTIHNAQLENGGNAECGMRNAEFEAGEGNAEFGMRNAEFEGTVTIIAEKIMNSSPFAAPNAQFIRVSVRDTGNGIPPEILPHVFERGVSGSGGTGLGLPICKGIIEAHGGEISIHNSQFTMHNSATERGSTMHNAQFTMHNGGTGTEVVFTLPIYAESVGEK